jgi:lipopolysaccharide/colanic/teichoic acid biosynthesis glycosyltransferase
VTIAVIIRLDSKGNPIFSQERVGKDGKTYILHKFRTMYKDHDDSKYHEYMQQFVQENSACLFDESGDDKFELIDDPRITRVGSLLRRSSLDELPQLLNIIKGEMSFIGPRPDIPFAVEFYKEHHKQRFQVKPGITGLWQIFPDRRRISFEDTIKLDIDYIKQQSLLLDIKIIVRTVLEILSFGRHQQGIEEVQMIDGMKNGIKA